MLSERDRETLRELERRLEHDDPEFVRAFARGGTPVRPPGRWERRLYTAALVLVVMLGVFATLTGAWQFVPAAAVATGLLMIGRNRARSWPAPPP